uniref:class I SAM-dependent methyltransferase n=1 Tax=Marinobacterium profundum TaxID=1714300 RepID=UPI00083221CB|nr:class I SAM-dependent methyltransferase [Marinobacterium profundum]
MSIDHHYGNNLQQQQALLSELRSACPNGADAWQLAPIDQLHTGGLQASLHLRDTLAACLASQPAPRILDAGSGAGGLLRLLAQLPGSDVTGLDLCHNLNRLSLALCQLYRPPRCVTQVSGDAHCMPFASDHFDAIVLQHSLLNMPNPDQALDECLRVLKPGGHLVLHELVQGTAPAQMQFPVPWAQGPEQSHLHSPATLVAQLQARGFQIRTTTDLTASTLAWRQRQDSRPATATRSQTLRLTPALILGPDFPLMFANLLHNLRHGAVGVMQYLACKPE